MTMPGPVTYEVTTISPDVQFGPNAQQIPGKQIGFTTNTGYSGSVFVPQSVLGDLDAVRAMIETEVQLVTAAQALKGTISGS